MGKFVDILLVGEIIRQACEWLKLRLLRTRVEEGPKIMET